MSGWEWKDTLVPCRHASAGWAHHGLTVTSGGEVVAFHPDGNALVFIDPSTRSLREVECPVIEAHDLHAVVDADGIETIWVADCGFAMCPDHSGQYRLRTSKERRPRVVRVGLDGELIRELRRPAQAIYDSSYFVPTAVTETPDGCVWVADGYGAGLVHRHDASGALLATLDGTDGAGRFDCPHGLLAHDDEMYVCDRERARLQVFDLSGRFARVLAAGLLDRPCAVAVVGEHLVVAELSARVTILDRDGRVVDRIGHDPAALTRPGWPNTLDEATGHTVAPDLIDGTFNSPHGVAVGADLSIWVTEWVVGGRVTRLTPVS